jgi:ferrous iron transport protein B
LLAGRTKHPRPDAVVVVADASNLARNLILVGELVAARMPIVVCLNMTDVAAKRQTAVDAIALGARLGATVVPTVASKGIGMEALRQAIAGTLAKSAPQWPADVPAPTRPSRTSPRGPIASWPRPSKAPRAPAIR